MAPLTVHDSSTSDPGARMRDAPAGTAGSVSTAETTETIAIAEALLTRRAGAPVRLADAEDLGGSSRSTVLRVRVAENPFSLPRTLVLKHYRATPAGPVTTQCDATASFRFEAASFQLVTALPFEDRVTPTLVANDPENRLLVIEDLGRCASLADKLHGDDPKVAERALLGWARSLGHLQAATAGREDDFGALLRRFGVRTWRDPLADAARSALAEVPDLLARLLGVEAAPAAVEEAHGAARLLGGSAYRAFSPSEVCPENCLVTGAGSRFLDFEWGSFRDVALSAASLRLPFPGCGSAHRLPPGMAEAMTASWQAEVAAVWPELADTALVAQRLMQAELLWVWLCTRALLPRITGDAAPEQLLVADPGPFTAAVLATQWNRLQCQAHAVGAAATAALARSVADALDPSGVGQLLPIFPAFAD